MWDVDERVAHVLLLLLFVQGCGTAMREWLMDILWEFFAVSMFVIFMQVSVA